MIIRLWKNENVQNKSTVSFLFAQQWDMDIKEAIKIFAFKKKSDFNDESKNIKHVSFELYVGLIVISFQCYWQQLNSPKSWWINLKISTVV